MSDQSQEQWPELALSAWRDTCATLQLWTQIVGKVRLTRSPWLNHSWHVALYVTARGLTTSPIPDGTRNFEIEFDFIDQCFANFDQRRRRTAQFALAGHSVAGFYTRRHGGAWRASALPSRSTRCRTSCRSRSGFQKIRNTPPTMPTRCGGFTGSREGRPGIQAVPHRLPRQGKPGAFLLGQLRSRGDALFRPPRPAPSRRRTRTSRSGGPRSLFARRKQRRFLARQRRDRLSRVLFLRLPEPAGFRNDQGAVPTPPSSAKLRRIPPALRRRAQRERPGRSTCSTSCKAPTRRQPSPRTGIAPRWNARPESPAWYGRFSEAWSRQTGQRLAGRARLAGTAALRRTVKCAAERPGREIAPYSGLICTLRNFTTPEPYCSATVPRQMLGILHIGRLLTVQRDDEMRPLRGDLVDVPLAAGLRHRIDLGDIDDRAGAIGRVRPLVEDVDLVAGLGVDNVRLRRSG